MGGTEVANDTIYASIDIFNAITGSGDFEVYEVAEWTPIADQYKEAPTLLFDSAEAISTGMTVGIVGAVAFVGSIIVKAVFLRRKLA